MNDVTRFFSAVEQGDPQAAEQLLPLVYEGLRALAEQKLAQENPGRVTTARKFSRKLCKSKPEGA